MSAQQGKMNICSDTTSHATGQYFCNDKQFAWQMPGNTVEAMPSGKVAFQEMLKAFKDAKKFIWVADWQMGFDVELDQRGAKTGDSKAAHQAQLIKVFENIIKTKNVQIRVLLWRSPFDILPPNTYDGLVTEKLNAINNKPDNKGRIIVLQQSTTSTQINSIVYSHHQKFAVVDGEIGFIGGIDLSYGRYETPEYDVVIDPATRVINEMYNTCATKLRKMSPDEEELVKTSGFTPAYAGTLLDEGCQARMPWQDVHLKFAGPAVVDLHRNFIRRWNATLRYLEELPKKISSVAYIYNPLSISKPAKETVSHPAEIDTEWLNHYGAASLVQNAQTSTPGLAIVQIVRSASSDELKLECTKKNDFSPPDDIRFFPDPDHRTVMVDSIKHHKDQHQDNILNAMVNCIKSAENYIYLENQFFISDFGSAGEVKYLQTRAGKIQYHSVDSRRMGNEGDGIKNTILKALGERIEYHIGAGTNFHVYLVFPVHPEGAIADSVTWKQHWQALASIKWGSNSLISRIQKSLKAHKRSPDDWNKYLTVLNMRSYGVAVQYARDPKTFQEDYAREIGRYVITEQIYVHTKMLIVDDAVAIIGSANINDRSLTGNGDSEIAAVVVDNNDVKNLDLGNPKFLMPTRKFARELRRSLWTKHFGFDVDPNAYFKTTTRAERAGKKANPLPDGAHPPREKTTDKRFRDATSVSFQAILDKPCDPKTVQAIQAIAASNARAYETVFLHTPRDGMKDFQNIAEHYTLPYPAVAAPNVRNSVNYDERGQQQHGPYSQKVASNTTPPSSRFGGAKEVESQGNNKVTAAVLANVSYHGVVPPALQPRFMTGKLAPFQEEGLRVPMKDFHNRYLVYPNNQVHDIGPAIDYLKQNVLGFFVQTPLNWGEGVKTDDGVGKVGGVGDISQAEPVNSETQNA
jgi:phospholipase D1/2